jgi:hypothetical protein
MFRDTRASWSWTCDAFLGKKQQNQQTPAREHAHKGLRLTGVDTFVLVQVYKSVHLEVTLEEETVATRENAACVPMNEEKITSPSRSIEVEARSVNHG